MKIKNNDSTYIIPESNNPLVISMSENEQELINCFYLFFEQKKKTKCVVYGDNGNEIKCNEANFIYVSKDISLENNFYLKSRSIMNDELSNIIEKNSDYFSSLELIRKSFKELCSDNGMYKVSKILSNGIDKSILFDFNELKMNYLLENLYISNMDLTFQEKMITLYNLMIYLNRDSYNIIYLDFEINRTVLNWIETIKSNDNLIIINNNSINDSSLDINNILLLSNKDYLETINCTNNNTIKSLSYLFHPCVRQYRSMQTVKNIELLDKYNNQDSTFFFNFKEQ